MPPLKSQQHIRIILPCNGPAAINHNRLYLPAIALSSCDFYADRKTLKLRISKVLSNLY